MRSDSCDAQGCVSTARWIRSMKASMPQPLPARSFRMRARPSRNSCRSAPRGRSPVRSSGGSRSGSRRRVPRRTPRCRSPAARASPGSDSLVAVRTAPAWQSGRNRSRPEQGLEPRLRFDGYLDIFIAGARALSLGRIFRDSVARPAAIHAESGLVWQGFTASAVRFHRVSARNHCRCRPVGLSGCKGMEIGTRAETFPHPCPGAGHPEHPSTGRTSAMNPTRWFRSVGSGCAPFAIRPHRRGVADACW